MHRYMRAIGFSKYIDRKMLRELIPEVVKNADSREYTMNEDNVLIGQFCKDFVSDRNGCRAGVAICGEFDEEDKFLYEYYYPYFISSEVTTAEDVSIERHAAKESYAGVCDDINVGISLIFYLQNMVPYVKAKVQNKLPVKGTTVTLTGLSLSGTILMPIMKNEQQKKRVKRESAQRNKLVIAARQGDENAIETLTLEDMDMYTTISKKIQREDVFSLVDSCFMPYGVECDQYSILGEILQVETVENPVTGEKLYFLKICCNELTFSISINIIDVLGEPMVGRRFKGVVWLLGKINYPPNLFL